MKKYILLPVMLICLLLVDAQLGAQGISNPIQAHKALKGQAGHRPSTTGNEKSDRSVGLIQLGHAVSFYTGTKFIQEDSSYYRYSHGRSYWAAQQSWQFDTLVDLVYDTSTGIWLNTNEFVEYFDANNYDTLYLSLIWDSTNHSWKNSGLTHYYFSMAGNIDSFLDQQWITGTSTWQNQERDYYQFNGSNQVIQWLYQGWNTGTQTWDNYGMEYYAYDGNGNQVLVNGLEWNSNALVWDSSYRYMYTYDNQHDQTSETVNEYDSTTKTWLNESIFVDSGFVATQPLVTISIYWNPGTSNYDTAGRWNYTYNAYGYVLTGNELNYDNGAFVLEANNNELRYYYQLDSTAAIADVSSSGEASIYPVPATGAVTITLTWQQAQPFNIAIYDLTGRPVYMGPVIVASEYRNTLPVQNLAPGNYLVEIKGETGEIVKHLVVLPH